MNTVHPVIAAALAPFTSAMQFLETPPFKPTPAKRPTPSETFEYTLCDVDLICELDYEAGDESVGMAANASLCEAFHAGVDIAHLLSDEHKQEIEIAFLEQERDDEPYSEHEGDFNADEKRPKLTKREVVLLEALQLMQGWVLHKLEPVMSGNGVSYAVLVRDMEIASQAIQEATGGNEQ